MNTLNENQSNEKKEDQRSCLERISDLTLKLWDQIGQNAADLAEDDFDFSEGAKKSSSKKSAKSKKNAKTIPVRRHYRRVKRPCRNVLYGFACS